MWRTLQRIFVITVLAGGLVTGCGERPAARDFQQAVRQFERGELVRAKSLFEKSIDRRPGHEINAYAHHYIGYIVWQLDDPTLAVVHFENSRRLKPTLFEPVYSLAVIAFEEDDIARARELFRDAAQLKPSDPRPFEYLARTHPGEAGRREARSALYEALERAPQSPRILTALAQVEWVIDDAPSAVSYLMQALEHDPDYPPALYNLGHIYAHWPDQEEDAIEYFNQYLAVAPETERSESARRALARLKGEEPEPDEIETAEVEAPSPRVRSLDDILADAEALADAGDVERAVSLSLRAAIQARQFRLAGQEERALLKAVELGPEDARSHIALGRHLAARDRHEDAVTAYQRATELESDWAHAWTGLADAAEALGDYDVALDALNKAVALEPDNPGPLWSLARLYDEAGVRRRAQEAYERFRERFGDDPRAVRAEERMEALQPDAPTQPRPETAPAPRPAARDAQAARDAYRRGASYQQRQEWDNALFFYRRAAQLDPALERAHYNMGLIHLERRNFREARDAFARSVELEPEKVSSLYNLALAYHEMRESQSALSHLDAALRINADYAPAHLLLGVIYAADPDTLNRARRHYERFLALRPDDPAAPAVRDWLARN